MFGFPLSELSTTGLNNFEQNENRELIKIVNILGREIQDNKNELLFYIYDNGTVEKRITME